MNLQRVYEATGIKEWSQYQLDVFDAVLNKSGHIAVQATAGSGKSTTLVAVANLIDSSKSCRFLAFNKIIADELNEKLPDYFPASTIHSYGYGLLRQTGKKFSRPDGYKLNRICSVVADMIGQKFAFDDQEIAQFQYGLQDLINMVRLTRTDVTNVQDMIQLVNERNLIGYSPDLTYIYNAVLEVIYWSADDNRVERDLSSVARAIVNRLKTAGWKGKNAIPSQGWIDFTDMVDLPVVWDVVPQENDFVLWDEAQDGTTLYFDFIMQSLVDDGRLIAVGDNKQNIMGWAGSFTNGMQHIVKQTNATELPLSVSYRCPVSHVNIMNAVLPGTESPSWAKSGEIIDTDEESLIDAVQDIYDNDGEILIMCRRNAPTVRFAVKLLSRRIPAKIRGRDFASNITSIIKQVGLVKGKPRNGLEFTDNFEQYLNRWYAKEKKLLQSKGAGETAFQSLDDKHESISILYNTTDTSNVWDFIKEIEAMFTDNGDKIQLSSVHRAKGRECENTAILEYNKMPLVWKTQNEQQFNQELCVQFVALSRSKNKLYLSSTD